MARLGADEAAKVQNAVNPNGLMDEGIYLARLDGEVRLNDKGNTPRWEWPFVIEREANGSAQAYAGRKMTHRTWLSDAAFWRLRETFEAFGVPTSTDTDELDGQKVRLHVVQKDAYNGELDDDGFVKQVNDIKAVLPAEGSTGVDEAAKERKQKAREAAKAARAEAGTGSAEDEDPLF